MKKIISDISRFLRFIFGYGIMIALMLGGLSFFVYLIALVIGGDTAALICDLIYKKLYPALVLLSTTMIALGLVWIYTSKLSDESRKQK